LCVKKNIPQHIDMLIPRQVDFTALMRFNVGKSFDGPSGHRR